MNGSSERLPTPFDDGEVYDLILKDIPYGFDFYTGLAKEARGPVLDVCCGTGRILLPCLQAGVDSEGLDLFAPMLSTLRQKAEELRLSVGDTLLIGPAALLFGQLPCPHCVFAFAFCGESVPLFGKLRLERLGFRPHGPPGLPEAHTHPYD